MRDEIRRIQKAEGIAAVHVTHDQEEALSMADRVVVMESGRIAQIGSPRALYERPATRDIAAFVGHANLWPGIVAGPDSIDTPIGRLTTMPHGRSGGATVTVLVRPERVRAGRGAGRDNTIAGEVTRDRFLGALRRFDLTVGGGLVVGETAESGAITEVHFSPDHVHILPDASSNQRRTP
jgi:putative spermidine/putrescine transport system ATP-binding protein